MFSKVRAIFGVLCAFFVAFGLSQGAMAVDAIPTTSLDWSALATELFTKLTPALTAFAGIALGVAIVVAAVRWIRSAVR